MSSRQREYVIAWLRRELSAQRHMLRQHQVCRDSAASELHYETGRIMTEARVKLILSLEAELAAQEAAEYESQADAG